MNEPMQMREVRGADREEGDIEYEGNNGAVIMIYMPDVPETSHIKTAENMLQNVRGVVGE